MVISIGTSGLFPYILEPIARARLSGIPTVDINPQIHQLFEIVAYPIALTAAEVLSQLWQIVDPY